MIVDRRHELEKTEPLPILIVVAFDAPLGCVDKDFSTLPPIFSLNLTVKSKRQLRYRPAGAVYSLIPTHGAL